MSGNCSVSTSVRTSAVEKAALSAIQKELPTPISRSCLPRNSGGRSIASRERANKLALLRGNGCGNLMQRSTTSRNISSRVRPARR